MSSQTHKKIKKIVSKKTRKGAKRVQENKKSSLNNKNRDDDDDDETQNSKPPELEDKKVSMLEQKDENDEPCFNKERSDNKTNEVEDNVNTNKEYNNIDENVTEQIEDPKEMSLNDKLTNELIDQINNMIKKLCKNKKMKFSSFMRHNILLFVALYCLHYDIFQQFKDPISGMTANLLMLDKSLKANFSNKLDEIYQETQNIYENCKTLFEEGMEWLSVFFNTVQQISSTQLKNTLTENHYAYSFESYIKNCIFVFSDQDGNDIVKDEQIISQEPIYKENLDEQNINDNRKAVYQLKFALSKNKVIYFMNDKAILFSSDEKIAKKVDKELSEIKADPILIVSYNFDRFIIPSVSS